MRAIAGGLNLYCAVTLDERLGCWRPLATTQLSPPPDQLPTITFRPEGERYLDVAMGYPWFGFGPAVYGCAIRSSGTVACFDRQPGIESLSDLGGTHPPFTRVFANHSSNSQFFCALTADGEAWCWGRNGQGQLGNGTTEPAAQPTRVDTDVRFTQLALGGTHTCGRDATGSAWCWGNNASGATGAGTFEGKTLTPVAVSTPTRFVDLSVVGLGATCGRAAAGPWWCWGSGFFATLESHSAVPQVTSIPAGARLATPDQIGLASDPAGNAAWWGDLYPTMDLHFSKEPRGVDIPFPVVRFASAVHDMAACVDADAGGNWLCMDLLWLVWGDPSKEAGAVGARPVVHGVP